MADLNQSVTGEQMANIESQACAISTTEERRGFMARMGRLGLTSIAAAALMACSPSTGKNTGDASADSIEIAALTLREQAIQLALEDVPAAEPYVDGNGDFGLRDAVLEGGMTPEAARSLRADWSEAYAEASRKVLHA